MIQLIRSIGRAKAVLAILDFLILNAVALSIVAIRTGFYRVHFERRLDNIIFFALSSLVAVVIFREFQLYKHKVYSGGYDQVITLAKAMLFLALVQAVGLFLIKGPDVYSRGLIGFYLLFGWLAISAMRVVIMRKVIANRKLNDDEPARRTALIVGAGDYGHGLGARFYGIPELGITLAGYVDDDVKKIGRVMLGKPVYGPISAVGRIARQVGAHELFIAINSIEYDKLLGIIEDCRRTGLPVTVASDHFRIVHDKIGTSEFRVIDSLTLRPRAFQTSRWLVKRAFDFVGSAILLTLLSPLFLLLTLAIKLTSQGPVFYKAQVVGKGGKLFTWLKFRTMYANRDEAIHREHLRKIITGNSSTQKITNDVRVTAVGRFLRKYSLDELPQLFSVIRGDMSLIGPRPCLPYEYEHYSDWHKKRFYVVPGMTGLWQILARNKADVTFNDSIILDLYYVQNQTMWLDLKILLRTVPAVLFGRGGA